MIVYKFEMKFYIGKASLSDCF